MIGLAVVGQTGRSAPVCVMVVAVVGTGTGLAAGWLVVVQQQPGQHEQQLTAGQQLPGAEPEPAG